MFENREDDPKKQRGVSDQQLELWPGMPRSNYPGLPKELVAFHDWHDTTLEKLVATEADENLVKNFIHAALITMQNIRYELGLEATPMDEPDWLEDMQIPRYRDEDAEGNE